MAITPIDIIARPFSIEPFTNLMLPDGIFDTALKKQLISCFCTNTSGVSLQEVTIYLEGISDLGIVPIAKSHYFGEIKPGASIRVSWLADFEHGTPGKKTVSFIAQAKGMSLVRRLKQIYVSRTTFNVKTGEYTCTIEEGVFKMLRPKVIGPGDEWRPCNEKCDNNGRIIGPWIPVEVSMAFYPNPSYSGKHGELPFGDPWWKILAILAIIVAWLITALLSKEAGGAFVAGSFEETKGDVNILDAEDIVERVAAPNNNVPVNCCTPQSGTQDSNPLLSDIDKAVKVAIATATAAGATYITNYALPVALSDDEDPWWRGQEATTPDPSELTVAEKVHAKLSYPNGPPNAGIPYPIEVKWEYTRITTGKSYTYSIREIQKNTHVNGGIEVDVPKTHRPFEKPLIIKTRIRRGDGTLFSGDDLYAFALLRSPDDMYFIINLTDDGLNNDIVPNDGTYTGSIHLEEIYHILLKRKLKLEGLWRVYIFAQDINKATRDMLPQIAAKHIGGFVIASGIQITFNPNLPCPLSAHATITFVQ